MHKHFVLASAVLVAASGAHGALTASASVSGTPIGGGNYHYTVTLLNTGSTTVGTLWFAWIPGGNFMATVPTNITSPAGWSAQVVGGAGAASILWQASTVGARLSAGGTLATFGFDSTSSPAALSGFAVSSPTNHVTTSYVYSGAAFSDAGFQFTASVVPAPAGAFALMLAPFAACRRRRVG